MRVCRVRRPSLSKAIGLYLWGRTTRYRNLLVRTRVDQAKPGEWVTGRGWIETHWQPPVFPTRQDLDSVAPNNPLILTRADGHASVVNSAALKIANVDKNTSNPFGGEISRDKQTGEPNGMLLDAAQNLVRRRLPPTSREDEERAILLG